jgi:hypothetical protein
MLPSSAPAFAGERRQTVFMPWNREKRNPANPFSDKIILPL